MQVHAGKAVMAAAQQHGVICMLYIKGRLAITPALHVSFHSPACRNPPPHLHLYGNRLQAPSHVGHVCHARPPVAPPAVQLLAGVKVVTAQQHGP